MIDIISQFPILVFGAIVAILGVLGVVIAKKVANQWDDEMEKESLEQLIRDDIEELISVWGYSVHKKIRFGMGQVGDWDGDAKVYQSYVTKDMKTVEPEDEDDEPDKQVKDYYYMKLGPASFMGRVKWKLMDAINKSPTEYVYVCEDDFTDNEEIVLHHSWNPEKIAGVWLNDRDEAGVDMIKERTYKDLFEETLETSKEHARAIQNLNLQFVRNMLEVEKLKELQGGDLKEQMEEFMQGR